MDNRTDAPGRLRPVPPATESEGRPCDRMLRLYGWGGLAASALLFALMLWLTR